MIFTKPQLLLLAVLALVLAGCATTGKQKEKEFELPASVQADMPGAPEAKTEAKETAPPAEGAAEQKPTAAETEPQPAAETKPGEAKPGVADQDSAAVLQRAKAQQAAAPVVTHDPEQVKQASAAQSDYNRALTEMKKGNLDSALERFRQLSNKYPLLGGPIVNQAIILRKKGQLEAAHKLLQDNLLTHSKNPHLLNELGVTSRELGQFKKAQVSYESAIRIDANYARAHYNLGVLADLYLHDPELALNEFNTYQKLLPQPDKKVAGWILELERRIARNKKK